jgi:hypothetical protein
VPPSFCLPFARPVKRSSAWIRSGTLIWAAGVFAATVRGEEADPRSSFTGHSAEQAWLANYDPTLISNRLYSEPSYEVNEDGKDTLKIENSLRWAIPLRKGLALGFQGMVPVKWVEDGPSDEVGIGNMEFRAGVFGRLNSASRFGIAVNAAFETASAPEPGDHAFALRPILAYRWDATDRVNVGFNVEYTFTPKDEGEIDASNFELKFPVAYKLNDQWSSAVTYKPRWNFEDDSFRQRLEFGGGYVWGSKKQYALSLSLEVPLSEQDLEWKLLSGLTWYF